MTIEKLQQYRKEQGLSYGKLAELSGVPLSTVQKIFGGSTKQPRYETLCALIKVLAPESEAGEGLIGWGLSQTSKWREQEQKRQWREAVVLREDSAYQVSQSDADGARTADIERALPLGPYTVADYLALPDNVRVELIDGYYFEMNAPSVAHQIVTMEIWKALDYHISAKKGRCMALAAPTDVQLDDDDRTMVQPDVMVVCDRSKLNRLRMVGAPDMVVEVASPGTYRKDMKIKFSKYWDAGVQEYWFVDPQREKIVTYRLEDGDYVPTVYGFQDKVPVGIFEAELAIDFAPIAETLAELAEE